MEDTRKRVKNLKLSYRKQPQKELLIAMPNPCPDREYEEEIITSEFTSLCPLNPGQPDYATLMIKYVPGRAILELKSLKFYLASFRMVETFYEEATNRILDDLVEAIRPRRMEIVADWNMRGGMDTRVTVSYHGK
ncbi:MAG: NADPH-dependent 7-cyano-7-deazaguanine reductase QueF [Chloroflexi bacterium]|nr:NADPH-dependent 7-cyano-7-deazaguanine reductase QueF [Chloroflexota bacterium]